ncbi:MAG: hypothetical protein ACLQRH_00950 [Acidimicrobiales bacterium]
MATSAQSKAQRRAESQRRAAERRAAELRAKRVERLKRYGALFGVIAVVVVIIVLVTSSSSNNTSGQSGASVKTVPIPASLQMIPAPKTNPGPEGIPIPIGPKLATLANAATGQTLNGVQCQDGEQLVSHVHTHVTIFVNGQARVIPYGVGIPGFEAVQTPDGPFVETGSCFYWLHTHAEDGIVHVESPSLSLHFTLGQFFAEWGVPLSATQVGSAHGKVTVFFGSTGEKPQLYKGDPADLPLGDHYQIQLNVGTPVVSPVNITDWHNL